MEGCVGVGGRVGGDGLPCHYHWHLANENCGPEPEMDYVPEQVHLLLQKLEEEIVDEPNFLTHKLIELVHSQGFSTCSK